jgi:HSP20 family protein
MFVLPLSRPSHALAHRAVAPQLARALDRLFDDSFDRYFGGAADGKRTPALDVTESDNAYTLTLDLPGVSREQLKVSVEGRRVSVETEDPAKPAAAAGSVANAPAAPRTLYRERAAARYARTVSLPAEVDQSASQAKFENGVLTLTLAKKVASGATRISVS